MELLKPLLTLLAVLNPVGVIPFFIHFTTNLTPAQRQRTIWVSTLTVFLVIAASALAGLQLLRFFGISIASFQVGAASSSSSTPCRCSTPSRPTAPRAT